VDQSGTQSGPVTEQASQDHHGDGEKEMSIEGQPKTVSLWLQADGGFRSVEVGKVTEVDLSAVDKEFLYFEKMPNGK